MKLCDLNLAANWAINNARKRVQGAWNGEYMAWQLTPEAKGSAFPGGPRFDQVAWRKRCVDAGEPWRFGDAPTLLAWSEQMREQFEDFDEHK